MKKIPTLIAVLIGIQSVITGSVSAAMYYENNYESGVEPKSYTGDGTTIPAADLEGDSSWVLQTNFATAYGPGNFFTVSDTTSHSGNYSLRFLYEARNGVCNGCGGRNVEHINDAEHNDVGYVIDKLGADLTIADNPDFSKADDGTKAEPGKFVYNTSHGYSKWKISSVSNQNATNDRINLELTTAGINGENTIRNKDIISVTRHCGIDGIVGTLEGQNDISRRNDCNSGIAWFHGISIDPQVPGESIFRRSYFKAEVTSPNFHQKLHYLRPGRENNVGGGEVVLFAESTDATAPNMHMLLTGFRPYGGEGIYRPTNDTGFDNMIMERGVWYYIEEEFKAATQDLATDSTGETYNSDGAYRLWFSKSGSEPLQANPSFELNNVSLPILKGGAGTQISFWGNNQHHTHSRGSFYIDDVRIADTWGGPVTLDGTNTSPPKAPTVQ